MALATRDTHQRNCLVNPCFTELGAYDRKDYAVGAETTSHSVMVRRAALLAILLGGRRIFTTHRVCRFMRCALARRLGGENSLNMRCGRRALRRRKNKRRANQSQQALFYPLHDSVRDHWHRWIINLPPPVRSRQKGLGDRRLTSGAGTLSFFVQPHQNCRQQE